MYSHIDSFDKLCETGCDFIMDKIKIHPFLKIDQTKSNLYELDETNKWIRDYLYQYNKLGFYTVMSQPGLDYPVKLYSSYLDYKKSHLEQNIKYTDGKFGIKQRAEVEGFMKLSKAKILLNHLGSDNRLRIGISNLESREIFYAGESISALDPLDEYATLSYRVNSDSNIVFMNKEDKINESIRFKYKNSPRDLKLSLMNHIIRRYFVVRTYPLKKHIPNLKDDDIVGVSIMDLVWDSNDYLWDKVLFALNIIK